jgi:hypothetical protein
MAETTSSIDPALRPYLETGLQRAQELFLTGAQPTFFPRQTFVSPSEQTLAALTAQERAATAGAPILGAAQQAFTTALGETTGARPLFQQVYGAAAQPGAGVFGQAAGGQFVNPAMAGFQEVAGGGFLQGSPYREALMTAATRPLVQQYAEQVVPGIASGFSRAGRYGSGAMQQAQARAAESFARGLGDVTANIAAQDFARERAFQEAARGQLAALGQQDVATRLAGATGLQQAQQQQLATQLAAATGLGTVGGQEIARQAALAQAAPSFFQMGFLPAQSLAQVGAAREAIARQPLQEEIARFQFEQQAPRESLMSFLSSVYGSPLRAYGTQTIPQAQTNPLGQAIGGAGLGYLGGQFLTNQFGANAPLYGAGIGALLGGLL